MTTEEYVRELGVVLRTFDPVRMKSFIEKTQPELLRQNHAMQKDKYMRGAMAKMILSRTDMDYKTREKAKQILDDLGWSYEIY